MCSSLGEMFEEKYIFIPAFPSVSLKSSFNDSAACLILLTSHYIYETRWNFSMHIYLDSIVHVQYNAF